MSKIAFYIKRMDKLLWLVMIIISAFSLLLLKSVSRATKTDYFMTQLFAIALGFAGAFFITLIDYRELGNFWYLIGGFSIFLMLYTRFFGITISSSGGVNATAWISIAGKTFQSSELVKIAFIVTFAKHLSLLRERGLLHKFLHVALLGVHALIPMALCHFQGDDGAAMIFFCMFLFMCLGAGVQLRYFTLLLGCSIIAVPLAWKYLLEPYQKSRFTAVYNLDDPVIALNDGWQQYQARISIGSGGLNGKGLFQGPRVESSRVTFQHSDFIFSVAGEELGFVGCMSLILLLCLLLLLTLYAARRSRDAMGSSICYGFFGMVFSQMFLNIGMCLAIFPVVGVTLPFFSAGGSSAACLYFGFGLVQAVSMHRFEVDGLDLARKGNLRRETLKM